LRPTKRLVELGFEGDIHWRGIKDYSKTTPNHENLKGSPPENPLSSEEIQNFPSFDTAMEHERLVHLKSTWKTSCC